MRLGANFCPGILHAVPAKDGLLVRIRIPGGLIVAHQLHTIADLALEFADGTMEITSRANLQLRGIQAQHLARIAERIALAGLLPSPLHDRVRNIATSPFAGLEPEETIDTRPLVRALDQQLMAGEVFAQLHPKFSFGVYGGSRRYSQESDDLSLEALVLNGTPLLQLSIGGVPSGFAVAYDRAVDCLLEVARMCIGIAKDAAVPARAKAILALLNALKRITDSVSDLLAPCPFTAEASSFIEALPGTCPAVQPGRVNIIPSVPLGRLTVEQGRHLAHTATQANADLRLAPWRGVLLGSVPAETAGSIVNELRSLGLSCDGHDGFQGIAACAGITGCDAALADVRGDAASLAQRIAGRTTAAGWTVNLSGCDKQCGRRHGAAAELIAGTSGYTLRMKGQTAASGCSPLFALDAVTTLHASMLSEVLL